MDPAYGPPRWVVSGRLLTDGFSFTAYVLDAGESDGLRHVAKLDLDKASPQDAYLWLDAYLLSQREQAPRTSTSRFRPHAAPLRIARPGDA